MANLRKRVAACDLERKRLKQKTEETRINERNQEQFDTRPLIIKVSLYKALEVGLRFWFFNFYLKSCKKQLSKY